MYLIVDDAGHEGVGVLVDALQDPDELLGAALLAEHHEDPVDGHEIERRDKICFYYSRSFTHSIAFLVRQTACETFLEPAEN